MNMSHSLIAISLFYLSNPQLAHRAVVTPTTKPIVVPVPKPIIVANTKLVVASASKPLVVEVPFVNRAGKGKDKGKEVVVETPKQWVPLVGSSSAQSSIILSPHVVHVEPTFQHSSMIPTIVASKPFLANVSYDPLLDHMMSIPREYLVLSEPIQPVFDSDLHVIPHRSCHGNAESSIHSDTASSIQMDGHQQGHFRWNSSDDLVGLGERQEADGFTIVQMRKTLKEPFVLRKNFDFIRRFLSFDVGLQNESDKIWCFWNLGTTVSLIVDHPQFLHIKVEDPRLARPLFVTPVYASCSPVRRRELWVGLHQISLSVDGSWLVGGDFNVIAHNGERTGMNIRDRGTSDFAVMMMDCGLTDAGLKQGLRWWNRNVFGDIFQRIRDAECSVDDAELDYDRNPSPSHRDTLHQAQAVLNRSLSIEKAFWKQKAWARWTCEGYHNTRYFHSIVQGRRIQSKIWSITSASGEVFKSSETIQPSTDNLKLNQTPTLTEVREAIFSIDPDSIAGPDGFSSHFVQVCWDIVSEDVFQAVLDFFAGGHLPRSFAATSIVLLPKRDNAYRWSEFRHISLCTVFNKLIMKLMNSRLSTLLPQIISAPQSRFITGRLIGDNVLLAQELLHTLDTKVRGGNAILKLDMTKAYDRMDWSFLISILEILGSMLFGLIRYGDVFQNVDSRSCLMADHMDFSHHLGVLDRIHRLENLTGFWHQQQPFTYLSVPLFKGARKIFLYDDLVQKVRSRIFGWASRLLSFGRRITLIGSMLSSISLYLLQIMKPPKAILKKLEGIFARFLWDSRDDAPRLHWRRWKDLCIPTEEGRLGFRRLQALVDTFSLKLWWLFRSQQSLWAQFLLSKYCKGTHPLLATIPYYASAVWKRLKHIGGDTHCLLVPYIIAEQIGNIPITAEEHDQIMWKETSDGRLATKSAWQLVRMEHTIQAVYNMIWSFIIPTTVSFFCWRLWQCLIPVDVVI
ncbi:Uncharacterized protein Adt_24516 [Abeliophyllum distichum]|uniref:Reverse transcriptase domain-containing protein n=1 Tax=Abeliophyllum distichum TaxID=126358 RepID=A0ABD1SDZ6_9LAMI